MSKAPILSVVGRTFPEQTRQECIDILEQILAKVRAGEVTEVAVAAITSDQNSLCAVSSSSNCVLMLGAINQLLYKLHRDLE